MKTKTIPVMLMLVAGAMACVLGFVYRYESTQFFTMVFTVLIVFYMLGCIVKIIIDKNFPVESDKNEENTEESEETKENINSEEMQDADE